MAQGGLLHPALFSRSLAQAPTTRQVATSTKPCHMTYLAVAISATDTDDALTALHRVTGRADLAELRLDLMQSFDLPRLLAERPLPMIVTCRPAREGGKWRGSEAERLAVLRQAAALGAEYVDLEWDVATEAATLDRRQTQVILSRHDFAGMPADLPAQAAALWAAGADVVKLVGMAQRLVDCAAVLHLLQTAVRPTIAIAMGNNGLATRLLAFRYPQAFLSFAAPDDAPAQHASPSPERVNGGTAPGQVTLGAMRDVYRVQFMSAGTKLVGLVQPAANASPLVMAGNAWLANRAAEAALIPLETADGEHEAQALDEIAVAAPFIGILSQNNEAGTVDARIPTSDRKWAFESVIEALRWLVVT